MRNLGHCGRVFIKIKKRFAGLMYHLPMDTITDNAFKGDVDETLFGNPTLDDGVRGKALSFNGVNQYAEINAHTYVLIISIMST